MFDNKEKSVNEFAKLISKLDAPSLIGLTRVLCVKVFYDDIKDDNGHPMPRSGEAIIEDCLVKFYSLNRTKRRDIMRIVRSAAKGR